MIRNGICVSFLAVIADLLKGHEFKLALYSGDSGINDMTEAYSAQGEVSGVGYTAGGLVMTGLKVSQDVGSISFSFDNPVIEKATISARRGLVYISTLPGNPAVASLDDYNPANPNGETSARNGRFMVNIPENFITLSVRRGA